MPQISRARLLEKYINAKTVIDRQMTRILRYQNRIRMLLEEKFLLASEIDAATLAHRELEQSARSLIQSIEAQGLQDQFAQEIETVRQQYLNA